jgi:hypothetical protein
MESMEDERKAISRGRRPDSACVAAWNGFISSRGWTLANYVSGSLPEGD